MRHGRVSRQAPAPSQAFAARSSVRRSWPRQLSSAESTCDSFSQLGLHLVLAIVDRRAAKAVGRIRWFRRLRAERRLRSVTAAFFHPADVGESVLCVDCSQQRPTVRVAAASQLEPTVAALTTAEPTLNPTGDGFGVVVTEVRLQLRRQREDRLVRQAQVLVELGP